MKDTFYLSRSFVEFGPFSAAEMQDFHKRGILKDSDYVSADSTGEWLHVNEWAASLKAPAEQPKASPAPKATKAPAPAPAPAAAAPAAKKAPAKKAAKKG